jgi:ethanolamine utilization protein EutQ (cupin superfamily)
MEWTILYDDYLHCGEGALAIMTKERALALQQGHGLCLPKGTWVTYEAKEPAKVVFAI